MANKTKGLRVKKFPVGLAIAGAIGFGVYYWGEAVVNYGRADEECLKFANETKTKISFNPDPDDPKLFAVKKGIRGSNVVVELGQKTGEEGKKGFSQSRLCVLGGGQISLPSMLEQWQYR